MSYLPRYKRIIPNLLVKTREDFFRDFYHLDFIMEGKFRKLIIFVFLSRNSLFCQILWHESVVKTSLLKSSVAHNLQKWAESRGLPNSTTDLSGVIYCLSWSCLDGYFLSFNQIFKKYIEWPCSYPSFIYWHQKFQSLFIAIFVLFEHCSGCKLP